MEKHLAYKVSFDTDKSSAHFFVNGIDDILKGEYFNMPYRDGLSGKSSTLKESILNQLNTPSKQKSDIEFNRYKQDCRKRALDLAEKTVGEGRKNGFLSVGMKDEKGEVIPKEVAEEMLLMGLADKYYNWLISIEN